MTRLVLSLTLTKQRKFGKDGKTFVSGMYSEKTGKSYSAYLVLTDDGQKSSYALEFDREKTGA